MTYDTLEQYDLLALVEAVKAELGGRTSPVFDNYRGQFFWHINGVYSTDWDAAYVFEGGGLAPGQAAKCKVVLGEHVKEAAHGNFPVNSQFAIREGAKIVAIGKILSTHGNA